MCCQITVFVNITNYESRFQILNGTIKRISAGPSRITAKTVSEHTPKGEQGKENTSVNSQVIEIRTFVHFMLNLSMLLRRLLFYTCNTYIICLGKFC